MKLTALSYNNKKQDVVKILLRKQKRIHDKPTKEILQEKNLNATASFQALFTHSHNLKIKQNYKLRLQCHRIEQLFHRIPLY